MFGDRVVVLLLAAHIAHGAAVALLIAYGVLLVGLYLAVELFLQVLQVEGRGGLSVLRFLDGALGLPAVHDGDGERDAYRARKVGLHLLAKVVVRAAHMVVSYAAGEADLRHKSGFGYLELKGGGVDVLLTEEYLGPVLQGVLVDF